MSVRAGPTDRSKDGPKTSAGKVGVRPGSGTHPHADRPHHYRGGPDQRPTPILAAGRGRHTERSVAMHPCLVRWPLGHERLAAWAPWPQRSNLGAGCHALPVRRSFRLDSTQGDRWELALQLLHEGGQSIEIGDVLLRRDSIGPHADGRVLVAVLTRVGPDALSSTSGTTGRPRRTRCGRVASLDDPRLNDLFHVYGTRLEYVFDYDNGAVSLGSINADGELIWHQDSEPNS